MAEVLRVAVLADDVAPAVEIGREREHRPRHIECTDAATGVANEGVGADRIREAADDPARVVDA